MSNDFFYRPSVVLLKATVSDAVVVGDVLYANILEKDDVSRATIIETLLRLIPVGSTTAPVDRKRSAVADKVSKPFTTADFAERTA